MPRNNSQTGSVGAGHHTPKLIGALVFVVAVIGGGVIWFGMAKGGDKSGQDTATFTAKRGP